MDLESPVPVTRVGVEFHEERTGPERFGVEFIRPGAVRAELEIDVAVGIQPARSDRRERALYESFKDVPLYAPVAGTPRPHYSRSSSIATVPRCAEISVSCEGSATTLPDRLRRMSIWRRGQRRRHKQINSDSLC